MVVLVYLTDEIFRIVKSIFIYLQVVKILYNFFCGCLVDVNFFFVLVKCVLIRNYF